MSSDFIKEDHHYIKTCILYEVLQKKPIFDSYRNFRKTVGPDVMDYPDFQFWYYRFYHGSRDFDYDRSADPEPKTLVDIPVVLMKKIAKYLDPVERTRLRTMNHAIKNVADSFPPVFRKIDIQVSNTYMIWSLNDKNFMCYKEGRRCSLHRPNCSIEKSETCHIKKGLEYLAPLLKMPNIQVNLLSLRLSKNTLNRNDFLPTSFNAKSVSIYGRNANQMTQFLSAMNPEHLVSICIDGSFSEFRPNYRMIFETDQFKQAKRVEFQSAWSSFSVEDLTNFSQLKRFKCHVRAANAFQDVPRIRDILCTFEELKSCELIFKGEWNTSIRDFAQALGEEIPIGPLPQGKVLTITHRYRIPESNARLVFKLKDGGNWCRFVIRRIR
ncbi:hypothetical protein B9Z55_026940 [Caenorhabditis nigoni]|nr:hypothetical protein B9Z55_026940 [Caenorhabditis nigoni]